MNICHFRLKKLFSLICVLMFLLIGTVSTVPANAAQGGSSVEKPIITHDIAIVFDNSASMYQKNRKSIDRWSRALYAIEAFASMLDYDYDTLTIYPMGDVHIGKGGEKYEKVEIKSPDDIKNIELIFSERLTVTTMAPAYTAMEDLKKSDKDQKWLIVMTDGEFTNDDTTDEADKFSADFDVPKWLEKKLTDFAKDKTIDNLHVQYLGFADAFKFGSKDLLFSASNAANAEELPNTISQICNNIFLRNTLPKAADGSFKTDVSMKSIIAFVQGHGAKINKLTTSDGKEISASNNIVLDAPSQGRDFPDSPGVPADVAGQVVMFNDCSAGEYKLDYTGSDIQVFYEPNVAIETQLLDGKGKRVDVDERINPGKYTVKYALVDAETGKDVSDSALLAPVNLSATVKNSKGEKEVRSGDKIELEADSNTEINIKGTFLDGYTITNASDKGPFIINVQPPELKEEDLELELVVNNVEMGRKWYTLSKHDEWKPIRVNVKYKGKPLTDKQMKNVTVTFNKDIPYRTEILPGESAMDIYIGQDENGEYVEPKTGRYSVTAEVTMKDEFGRSITKKDDDRFEVQKYSPIWRWLTWVLIIAGIIALIVFVLNLPAWPRKMTFVVEKPSVDEGVRAKIDKRSTGMKLIPYEDALRCNAQKNSKVKDLLFKPGGMSIICTGFTSEEIRMFRTGGHTYTDNGENFVCGNIENEVVFNGSQFEYTFLNGSKGSGHIEIK